MSSSGPVELVWIVTGRLNNEPHLPFFSIILNGIWLGSILITTPRRFLELLLRHSTRTLESDIDSSFHAFRLS